MTCPANFTDLFTHLFRRQFYIAYRELRLLYQKYTSGWDDSELWNLDATICKFVLPRLKRYNETRCGYPSFYGDDGEEAFNADLNLIIWAMEQHLKDDWLMHLNDQEKQRVNEGFEKFGVLLRYLWS